MLILGSGLDQKTQDDGHSVARGRLGEVMGASEQATGGEAVSAVQVPGGKVGSGPEGPGQAGGSGTANPGTKRGGVGCTLPEDMDGAVSGMASAPGSLTSKPTRVVIHLHWPSSWAPGSSVHSSTVS